MKKLIYLLVLALAVTVLAPTRVNAQIDSTCQVFGAGNSLSVNIGAVKRYYTKFIPGALYGWSVVGGNAVIVGPRNQSYVDIQGTSCGPFTICVSYSVDGQSPCCVCVNANVVGCTPPPPSCCINYVNSTMQPPWIKVKFQTCGTGIVKAKLFRTTGNSQVLLWTDYWPSGYNPAYTYNLNITNFSCNEIFCLKICGYKADNTECCTTNFAIIVNCDGNNNFIGVSDYNYPGCNVPGGGGGGIPIERQSAVKEKLLLKPNPTSNFLEIKLPESNKIEMLQIFDRNGTVVNTVLVKGKSSVKITVSNLVPGSYFIKPDDANVESVSFIKQ